MTKRSFGAALLLLGFVLLLPLPAQAADEKQAQDELFGLTRVWRIDLNVSAKDYAAMQPAGGGGFGGPPRPPAQPGVDSHRNTFGVEFPWAKAAEVTIGDKTYKDVGIRYKGNFTYMAASRALKRPLKLDLDRHVAEQHLHGLKKFNLHNSATDSTMTRETVSYAFFRAAGVPAPRTAFAEVTLTVPDKYNKEFVGLYTVAEQVDRTFLKTHFKNNKGMLLKPEGLQGGLSHHGDDWTAYEQRYRPQDEPSAEQKKRLIEFTRLINQADDARFAKEIGDYLDVDAFLRYLAANALLANLDSFLGFGHNFYLYLHPDTNKFAFIPWDLDYSMGTWPAGGTSEQQLDLSVMHPHAGQNKLIDRLLAIKDVNDKYRKVLAGLTADHFTTKAMMKDYETVEKTVKEALAKEARAVQARREGASPFGGMFGRPTAPRTFIEKRPGLVASQLEGKTQGFVPTPFGAGGPGGGRPGFGGPPQPGEVLPGPLQDALRLTPEQRRKIAEIQKETDAKVQEVLTEEQKAQLRRIKETRPGGRP